MGRRLLLVLASALFVAGAAAPPAGAHAVLERSEPPDGSALATAPGEIRLRFSEPVADRLSRVDLLDGHGRAVPGARLAAAADRRTLMLSVPALRRGPYQVTWQVLAEDDGHVTGGAVAFGVGTRVAPAGGGEAGSSGRAGEAALRWLDFALLAGVIGSLAVSAMLASAAAARRRLLAAAACSAALAAAVGAALFLLRRETPADLLGTRWGALWVAREALLAGLAATALVLARRQRRTLYGVAGSLAAALAASRALSGHAAAGGATVVAADTVHVLAAALWVGGLVVLAVLPRPLVRQIRRPFAWTAGVSVAALAVTGLYAAGVQVASVDALLETFYGRTLMAKVGLVLVVGGLGLANGLALRRHGRSRLLAVEAVAALEVLVAAALLTASVPARGPEFAAPRAAASPPVVVQAGDLLVSALVRPNRPGANVITVLAVSSRRPPPAPVDGVSLRLVPGEGAVRLRRLAPDRWAGGAVLPDAGDRTATVIVDRGGREVTAGLAWTVAPPDPARAVVVSARPLAPLLNRAAAVLLIAAAVAGTWLAVRGRVPRLPASLKEEPT